MTMVDQLALERAPEALHRGVVIAVPFSAHRGPHAELVKQFLVVRARVLASPIRMMNEATGRTSHRYCPEERLGDQFRGNPRSERIPDNLAVEEIFMGSTVEPAFIGGYVAQIAHPDLVGRRCGKLLTEQILRDGEVCALSASSP